MFTYFSKVCLAFTALIGLAITLNPGQSLAEKVVPASREQVTFSYAPVVKRTAPAVVNIYAKKVVKQRSGPALFEDPFFKKFFGDDFPFGGAPKERIQNSLGSGVLVRADGVVVTNNHVIEDAQEITVVLSDRREFDAEIVLADDRTDLAVLRIDTLGEGLPSLEFADSDALAPVLSRLWRAPASAWLITAPSFRPMRRSIQAIRAARWLTWMDGCWASTRRFSPRAAAQWGSALPYPPIWCGPLWIRPSRVARWCAPGSASMAALLMPIWRWRWT
jgi:hypothetical protein